MRFRVNLRLDGPPSLSSSATRAGLTGWRSARAHMRMRKYVAPVGSSHKFGGALSPAGERREPPEAASSLPSRAATH
jgi:hypothetical protein